MNTTKIKTALLGVLLAAVPLADSIAHTSTPTPTIEERLAEKCAEKQVKAISKFQGCVIVALIRGKTKAGFDTDAAIGKCATRIADTLVSIEAKYEGFCSVSGQDMSDAGLPAYIRNRAACFVEYFMENNTSCGFP